MEDIIPPVDRSLLLKELTRERFLRHTNKAGNDIYVVTAHNAPNVMREIGRLREMAFRDAGGGTGFEADIDRYDTMQEPCRQLIVWNPDAEEIIGGYRYILGNDVRLNADGQPDIATAHLFRFSDRFLRNYLPHTLELGRSFIQPKYQSIKGGAKSLYALDNIWDGLGALTVRHPEIQYFFGKVTMYPSFGSLGRDMILHFLNRHFGDRENLVTPITPLEPDKENLRRIESLFPHSDMKDNYKILNHEIRALGQNIPPLVNAYMNLSGTMKVFGTAINDEFGYVEETGILVTVSDIYSDKRERHIETYAADIKGDLQFDRFGIS